MINPHQHHEFLGASFINRQDEIVLRIGSKQWTRTQLVQHIGVGNMAAAGKLSSILRKMKVQTVEQLYTVDPRDFALIPKLGETTVFVAMAVLKAEGFNVKQWYTNIAGAKKRTVTFRTLKIQRAKKEK